MSGVADTDQIRSDQNHARAESALLACGGCRQCQRFRHRQLLNPRVVGKHSLVVGNRANLVPGVREQQAEMARLLPAAGGTAVGE